MRPLFKYKDKFRLADIAVELTTYETISIEWWASLPNIGQDVGFFCQPTLLK